MHTRSRTLLLLTAVLLFSITALAQGLNWEGQTGAFVTPFAYTSSSPANGFGHPQVAFHFLAAGPVVGNAFEFSITEGLLKRVEFGYTRALVSAGDASLSPLFDSGFNIVHAKVNFLPENAGKSHWVPALSVGVVARTPVSRVGGVLTGTSTTNGDGYLVGTKTITFIKHLPILINAGAKVTNAALLGMAGNAPAWKTRGFGAAAFVLSGPAKSKIAIGSEILQEPRQIKDLPGASLPTTLTYFARVIPNPERSLNLDFGVAQAAGRVLPGADVQARARFAFGISYRF